PILAQRIAQQAGSLSGGEQQMLCIGRALMSRPRLLLLDEPSLGLAPKIVRQIFELIARIREAGTSILLVEQNVRGALKVADHAHVMEGGRVVLSGPAAQLREDPRVRDAYLGGAGHAVTAA
ncbi:MAG: ATP-binding cassette domain-containing protein, partial [Fimbriimonadaceae bacterium]